MSKTYRLFWISFAIVSATMIVATFGRYLNLGQYSTILAAVLTIAFGISIAGLIFGVTEVKKSRSTKVIIGLSGHLLITFLFLYIVYIALTMESV